MFISSNYIRAAAPVAVAEPVQQRRAALEAATVPGAGPQSVTDTVTISQAARDKLAGASASPLLSSQALLLPSQGNIAALQKGIASAFPQFLARNNIPSAPESITYDTEGKVQLPADYPHAAQFQQALEADPAMARDLSTANALASHWAEMQKTMPFQQEYGAAATPAAAKAVVAKYGHLFSGNPTYARISLQFSPQGQLSVTADGKAVA